MNDAAGQAGVPRVAEINCAFDGGIGYSPRTIWKGGRQSAVKAFLLPARKRKNLTVMAGADVLRIVFERLLDDRRTGSTESSRRHLAQVTMALR